MTFWGNHSSKKKFMPTGGTIGEGNPTFEFSHCVIVATDDYYMILGKASVSDVTIKTYENNKQLPPDITPTKPQFYQLRINRRDWEDKYKDRVNKKVATDLDLYLADKLSNFAHSVDAWHAMTDADFPTCSIACEIDLGENALKWLSAVKDKSIDGNALDDIQLMKIESKIIDFPVMMFGLQFSLQDVKDHLTLVFNSAGSTGNSNNFGGGNYTKVNTTEQKLTLLKTVLHSELCDPKTTPTPADVKLSQVANDLTMMPEKKLDNLKYLLGLIFN